MAEYVGALDQGTTSTRFVVFDREGHIVSVAQKEHRQIYPQPGFVEHDPEEIFSRSVEVMREALEKGGINPQQLKAIGITNQRETTILWDKKTGKPVHNAIVWQDTRTAEICEKLAGDEGIYRFQQKTGLPLATYFSGPKIRWLFDHIPGLFERAKKKEIAFGTIDSWLVYKLTGCHVTDVTNASRTLLFDIRRLCWDEEMCEVLGIPMEILPEVVDSSHPEAYGKLSREILGESIPVTAVLGDQQAALFGQTCYEVGEAKNTYGTGCFLLVNIGEKVVFSTRGILTTVGYRIHGENAVYAMEGSVAIAGALIQWARDKLGLIEKAPQIDELAMKVEDSGGIYIVPAFSGLFAPYWRSDARGVVVGLTHYTNRYHLARAILEATAYQTREIFDAMMEDAHINLKELRVDGGMVVSEPLMQFQSDILGIDVVRPRVTETTALGAAYAAGLAIKYWQDKKELRSHWQIEKRWQPRLDAATREALYRGWKKAVTRTFNWVE
ncbi:glycerol kinase GlpK [Thermospira aquatica]|uniref:Glycerol kinase n=1 Tax=Thermospira aquatica TaxID=2828656 RepID=A0AAX3BE48_9SPIR|nr:glycerol kinase GlpK [Thermospira aquatica]URA10506.1 glycerol kinase GlpK [Thermospira aquatica]